MQDGTVLNAYKYNKTLESDLEDLNDFIEDAMDDNEIETAVENSDEPIYSIFSVHDYMKDNWPYYKIQRLFNYINEDVCATGDRQLSISAMTDSVSKLFGAYYFCMQLEISKRKYGVDYSYFKVKSNEKMISIIGDDRKLIPIGIKSTEIKDIVVEPDFCFTRDKDGDYDMSMYLPYVDEESIYLNISIPDESVLVMERGYDLHNKQLYSAYFVSMDLWNQSDNHLFEMIE